MAPSTWYLISIHIIRHFNVRLAAWHPQWRSFLSPYVRDLIREISPTTTTTREKSSSRKKTNSISSLPLLSGCCCDAVILLQFHLFWSNSSSCHSRPVVLPPRYPLQFGAAAQQNNIDDEKKAKSSMEMKIENSWGGRAEKNNLNRIDSICVPRSRCLVYFSHSCLSLSLHCCCCYLRMAIAAALAISFTSEILSKWELTFFLSTFWSLAHHWTSFDISRELSNYS